ncbi:glycine cleavage system protein R [Pseudocolwellia agarivorans]|uniref:glycine cleavage system protein R n=1 Tax=Pseudocolwellia agarivorans TaxID=1911682 RepID=UPI003F8855A3
MKNLIISFISLDRPGLVDTISNVVRQHNGNWQSSSLNHMSGYFTGAIEVAVEAVKSQGLIDALNDIEGLESNIKISDNGRDQIQPSIVLEITANDREGIIQEVSSIIHKQGGNLIKVVSETEIAPHSGQELFKAKVTVTLDSQQIDKLTDAIESLADDLMVDVTR